MIGLENIIWNQQTEKVFLFKNEIQRDYCLPFILNAINLRFGKNG